MRQFHAKLRPPMQEILLGCEISSLEERQSKLSGRNYVLIRFSNCPFVVTYHAITQRWLHQILHERGIPIPAEEMRVGGKLNLHLRWKLDPHENLKGYYPHLEIDLMGLTELIRCRFSSLRASTSTSATESSFRRSTFLTLDETPVQDASPMAKLFSGLLAMLSGLQRMRHPEDAR